MDARQAIAFNVSSRAGNRPFANIFNQKAITGNRLLSHISFFSNAFLIDWDPERRGEEGEIRVRFSCHSHPFD